MPCCSSAGYYQRIGKDIGSPDDHRDRGARMESRRTGAAALHRQIATYLHAWPRRACQMMISELPRARALDKLGVLRWIELLQLDHSVWCSEQQEKARARSASMSGLLGIQDSRLQTFKGKGTYWKHRQRADMIQDQAQGIKRCML